MKKIFLYILFIVCPFLGGTGFAQTAGMPPPHVINSAGQKDTLVGTMRHSFNIGEPIVGTSPTYKYYTQGFLQPDYRIGTAFNATIFVFNESCQGAADGSIISNAYNNKGSVKYSLSPSPSGGDTTGNIKNLPPGTYTLTVADSVGRSVNRAINILASSEICPVTAYHAFSPNADGLNDLYIITGIENYPDNHVYFFNRWGTKVWDAAKYDNVKTVWDGKDSHGNVLSPGTYFYVIDITGKKPLKNWVEITK